MEPFITINGSTLNTGEAMTLRVALETWAMELENDPNCLGTDEHGHVMRESYLHVIRRIQRMMMRAP